MGPPLATPAAHSFASTSMAQRWTRWCAIAYGGGVRSTASAAVAVAVPPTYCYRLADVVACWLHPVSNSLSRAAVAGVGACAAPAVLRLASSMARASTRVNQRASSSSPVPGWPVTVCGRGCNRMWQSL